MWRYIDVLRSSVDLGVIWGTEISIFWYLGSGKTWLKCSKFRKAPARRLANDVASESTPQEKKEGRV